MIQKTIFSLWNTGVDTAPEVVQRAINSWKVYAPDYNIRILEEQDLIHHLADLSIDDRELTIQASSDILRTKLLMENGGIWLDATCLLTEPLDGWVVPNASKVGFLALTDPGVDRIISSWFLASEAGSPILSRLMDHLLSFWSVDRKMFSGFEHISRFNIPARRRRAHALKDPIWAVDPSGYAHEPFAPYFFFHYLFAFMIEIDPEIKRVWMDMPKLSAVPAHSIGHAGKYGDLSSLEMSSIERMLASSPIHKLNWRLRFPDLVFQHSFDHGETSK